jgi:hypothetical protein
MGQGNYQRTFTFALGVIMGAALGILLLLV